MNFFAKRCDELKERKMQFFSHVEVVSSRIPFLQVILDLWNKTGVPLLYYDNNKIIPFELFSGDDDGFFYFVPYLAKKFGCTADVAAYWWDLGIVVAGCLVALTAFMFLVKTTLEKIIAFVGISFLGLIAWNVCTVYILPFFAFCFFPCFLVLLSRNSYKALWGYCLLLGGVIAFSNSIRLYAALPLVSAVVVSALFSTMPWRKLVVATVFLLSSLGGYSLWFASITQQPRDYCARIDPEYTFGGYKGQHLFWHIVYVGLGFIPNDFELYYGDGCGYKKAQEIDKNIILRSSAYDEALKGEVLALVKGYPHFVLRVLFAKAGVLFYYLLLFANLGLICAWFYRKPWYVECGYRAGLLAGALPGILSIPVTPYVLGFISAAVFYGLHSIIWALQHGMLSDLRMFFKKRSIQATKRDFS